MAQPSAHSASPLGITRRNGRITASKDRTFAFAGENERCKAFDLPAQVGGPEPDMQCQLAAMDDGARGYRGLRGTLGALERPGLGFQGPGPVVAAGRAAGPLRPADAERVLGTGAVIGEAALKCDQETRIVGQGEDPSR